MNDRYVIPSLDRAVSVLELLGDASQGMSLAELVRQSSIPKSTLFRILITLQKRQCVVWDEHMHSYRLGSKLWSLGSSFLDQSDLYRMAARHMRQLAEQTRKTIFLGTIEEREVVYLRKMESPSLVSVVKKLGQRVPALSTATGMAMLAFLPKEDVAVYEGYLPSLANNARAVAKWATVLERLELIREQGYAIIDGEYNKELLCISAPVFDHTHHPCASLTVAMLSRQVKDRQDKFQLAHFVKKAAHAFSEELGYSQSTNAFR